jgi:hypothetical protein
MNSVSMSAAAAPVACPILIRSSLESIIDGTVKRSAIWIDNFDSAERASLS